MQESAILNAVTRAVRQHAAPKVRVLDLSCGDGDIIERLAQLEYSVEGTHFREDDYIIRKASPILEKVPIHEGVDLCQPLPFADSQFDVILATEVLEHLPAHAPIVSEIARILNVNGLFVFTTPNTHRLSSRIQFFLTGTHNLCGARLGWHVNRRDLYSTHFNPLYFPVFHSLLHQNGLQVKYLGFTRCKLPIFVLLALLYPILAPATVLEVAHFWKRSHAGGRDLLRWMLNPRMLLSDQMVVAARKRNGDSGGEQSPGKIRATSIQNTNGLTGEGMA